jgi:hypothetical protein
MVALWGRNVLQQINRKCDLNYFFLRILNVIVNDVQNKTFVCTIDGSNWMSENIESQSWLRLTNFLKCLIFIWSLITFSLTCFPRPFIHKNTFLGRVFSRGRQRGVQNQTHALDFWKIWKKKKKIYKSLISFQNIFYPEYPRRPIKWVLYQ